jgi:hypothetical protein
VDSESVTAALVTRERTAIAEAIVLMRNHPQWAIWLPASGSDWAAIRPASSRPPAPELPTIWVHAGTARDLARLMQAADEQVSGRGQTDHESRHGHAR